VRRSVTVTVDQANTSSSATEFENFVIQMSRRIRLRLANVVVFKLRDSVQPLQPIIDKAIVTLTSKLPICVDGGRSISPRVMAWFLANL